MRWFDLPVTDLADAMAFYEKLLGWQYRQMDASTESGYVMIESQGQLIGGLRRWDSGAADKLGAIPYFSVDALEPAVQRARDLGAAIVGSIVDLGGGRGRYQWIRDREGRLVGLWAAA